MSDFRIGQHDEAIKSLVADMSEMKSDMREVRDYMAERKGERRVGLWLFGSASGAFGAVLAFVLQFVMKKP